MSYRQCHQLAANVTSGPCADIQRPLKLTPLPIQQTREGATSGTSPLVNLGDPGCSFPDFSFNGTAKTPSVRIG